MTFLSESKSGLYMYQGLFDSWIVFRIYSVDAFVIIN